MPVKAVVPFSERRHKAVTAPLQHQAVDLGDVESEAICARCGLRRTFSNRLRETAGEVTDWKRGAATDG